MAGSIDPAEMGNRREHRRYPAWLEAALTDPEARTSAPATIVDISLGGALLQSHQCIPAGGEASLAINSPLGVLSLTGTVIRTEASWTGNLLHMEFQDPGPAGRIALLRLLDDLERDFKRHQAELASHRRL